MAGGAGRRPRPGAAGAGAGFFRRPDDRARRVRVEAVAREAGILLVSILYAIVGVILLFIGYRVLDFLTPTDMSKKIFEENNVAVGVLAGFFILALAVVIHGAIHG
jgi:uncharacterized membrane protein YjfL (UPF0719 family)